MPFCCQVSIFENWKQAISRGNFTYSYYRENDTSTYCLHISENLKTIWQLKLETLPKHCHHQITAAITLQNWKKKLPLQKCNIFLTTIFFVFSGYCLLIVQNDWQCHCSWSEWEYLLTLHGEQVINESIIVIIVYGFVFCFYFFRISFFLCLFSKKWWNQKNLQKLDMVWSLSQTSLSFSQKDQWH